MTPYVSSPLLYGDTLYFLRHNQNILSRLEPTTGKPRGEALRLEGITDFHLCVASRHGWPHLCHRRDGTTIVLRHDRENATLAVNHLDDSFSASPALAAVNSTCAANASFTASQSRSPRKRKQGQ